MTIKEFLKKFYFLVWKDESLLGWFISVIFLLIVLKFIFFPGLSLITQTALPIAIVESCSMYHEGNSFSSYNTWWEQEKYKYEKFDISKDTFSNFIFKKGFNKGDILFIIGVNPTKLKVGEVIIFKDSTYQNPIIHRIVKIKEENGTRTFATWGDNNNAQLPAEKIIQEDQIMGKAVTNVIPYAGWIKLIFFERLKPEYQRGFCN